MAGRPRKGIADTHVLVTAMGHAAKRSLETAARRWILAGALLTMVWLSMSAVEPLASSAASVPSKNGGAATTPTHATSTASPPTITPPTITTPATTTPAVTTPTVTTPTVTITRPTVTLPTVTITKPTVTTPPIGAPPVTVPTSTTPTVTVPRVAVPGTEVATQRRLRSLVVRLSGCLSTLPLQARHLLLLRAEIETARLQSGIAVARSLHISPAREAELEHASLLELQTAASHSSCGSIPAALIEVPARDQLVLVDPVLVNAGKSADKAQASRVAVRGVGNERAKLSFTLSAGKKVAGIKKVIVALPRGLAFSKSKRHLLQGIVARARGKRLKLTAKVSHGTLAIKLRTPEPEVQFTIASPAITVSKSLARRVRTRKVKTFPIPVTATSTSHKTTRIALNPGAR
jgi:hypothetical protein